MPDSSVGQLGGRPALGSATHGPHIFDLRAPWGGPRFYPPGEHPATYRWREQRRMIEELLDRMPLAAFDAPDAYRQTCEALAYIDQKLAEFEAGEDEAKRREWFYIRDHLGLER